MLWVLGFFVASIATAFAAGFLERNRPDWSLWGRLFLASLATPVGWLIFQAVVLLIILQAHQVHAGFSRRWPSYFQEVVIEASLKLWVCGALCAVFLRSRWGYLGLYGLCLTCAAAVLLPIGMEIWIDTGQIGAKGLLLILFSAAIAGFIPVFALGLGVLFRFRGIGWPAAIAGLYAGMVGMGALVWHNSVLGRPGAWSILPVTVIALMGTFFAWLRIRVTAANFARLEAQRAGQGQTPLG